ncbi:MAG: hypothetical protein E7310_03210 [Clostridiales bacterium]|nr:hypothetical protein [Clostridiales bacterium]
MKSISIKILKIMLLLVIGICLFSIANKAEATTEQESSAVFSIKEKSLSITVGQSRTLRVVDSKGITISKMGIDWSSNNPDVATVSGGIVRGKSPGTAIISAEKDGYTTSISVRVDPSSGNSDDSNSISGLESIIDIASIITNIIEIIFSIILRFIPV